MFLDDVTDTKCNPFFASSRLYLYFNQRLGGLCHKECNLMGLRLEPVTLEWTIWHHLNEVLDLDVYRAAADDADVDDNEQEKDDDDDDADDNDDVFCRWHD